MPFKEQKLQTLHKLSEYGQRCSRCVKLHDLGLAFRPETFADVVAAAVHPPRRAGVKRVHPASEKCCAFLDMQAVPEIYNSRRLKALSELPEACRMSSRLSSAALWKRPGPTAMALLPQVGGVGGGRTQPTAEDCQKPSRTSPSPGACRHAQHP